VRKVALEMFSRVVIKTPSMKGVRADPGNARSVRSPPDKSITSTRPAARRSHVSMPRVRNREGWRVVYLVSNLVYINALEYGHRNRRRTAWFG
jgi:hypothetical protein